MRISDWSSDVCSSDLPAPQAAQAAVASSPGKDVAAVALGMSDAVATPVPPPVPSPESATDEASDGPAPGDLEHDVADSANADGPFAAPRPLVCPGFQDGQARDAAECPQRRERE